MSSSPDIAVGSIGRPPHGTPLSPAATADPPAVGIIPNDAWPEAVNFVGGAFTLPLIIVFGTLIALNLFCVFWYLTTVIRSHLVARSRKQDRLARATGCRWRAETLSDMSRSVAWVCNDCGAIIRDRPTRPPRKCAMSDQKSAQRPTAA